MLKKYINGFCVDGAGVIEENARQGVKEITILTSNPLEAEKRMQNAGLKGSIVVKPEQYKRFKGKTFFPLKVYVDLTELDEKEVEQISLENVPVVIPLFDNLFKTGIINSKYELSPAKIIEQFGFLDRDCTIVGGMYADKDDLMLLGGYSPTLVICPRAHARAGGTFANIKLMQKYGLKLRLGTLDEKVDIEREIEYLFLTTLSLLENSEAVTIKDIERIGVGE